MWVSNPTHPLYRVAQVGKAGSIPEEIHPAANGSPLDNAIIVTVLMH